MSNILSIEELIYLDVSEQTVELLSKTTALLENLKSLSLELEKDKLEQQNSLTKNSNGNDDAKSMLLLQSREKIPKGKKSRDTEINIRKYSQEYKDLWDEYNRLLKTGSDIV